MKLKIALLAFALVSSAHAAPTELTCRVIADKGAMPLYKQALDSSGSAVINSHTADQSGSEYLVVATAGKFGISSASIVLKKTGKGSFATTDDLGNSQSLEVSIVEKNAPTASAT